MPYALRVQVPVEGAPGPHDATIRYSMPGNPTDAQVRVIAARVMQGYRDVYSNARHVGLAEVDLDRQIVAAGDPLPPT